LSSSLKFWKASTNVNESKQVSPIFMILWPRQQLPKQCSWWKQIFLSLKVEFVILWFYNLIYLAVILWVYHLFMYITAIWCPLASYYYWLLYILVRSCEFGFSVRHLEEQLLLPAALWGSPWFFKTGDVSIFQTWCSSVSRFVSHLLEVDLISLWLCDTNMSTWSLMVINGHYRYSQRLLQAAGDKGMLGPSGSKSSSSSGSGFSDWIAISYRVIRDIFPRCRIGHSVNRLCVSNCYFRSYSKLPGCMSWCCWWHSERQAERATACNTWTLDAMALSSNKICIIFRILNNIIYSWCACAIEVPCYSSPFAGL